MKSFRIAILLAAAFAAVLTAAPAAAQTEELFGTRSIRACGDPVKSQPNTKQIEELIRCKFEKKSTDRITLVEDIKVEAGKTRAYNQFNDGYASGIDTDAKVLPIRGSLTTYQCNKLVKDDGPYQKDNHGRNCLVVKQPNAEGKCFKTTFGDWWCGMQELIGPENFLHDQPPPK